jgi:hypothetical protein
MAVVKADTKGVAMPSPVDIHPRRTRPRGTRPARGLRARGIRAACLARSALLVVVAAACLLSLAALLPAEAAALTPLPGHTDGWTQVIKGGFTDPNNSYAAFSAEYKGYLFVSTIANKSGTLFSGSDKMGGDILRSADGVTWEQIGKPGLGNPQNSTFRFVIFKDRLYAVSDNLDDHGLEIWVTSDGSEFTQIEKGGFGDKNNTDAQPLVFNDRLILGVSNSSTGAQIWVSDDGESFRQVVPGGMGGKNNSGINNLSGTADSVVVFQGKLYVGATNPADGGQIWRTADGLEWERVAVDGLERRGNAVLLPSLVFQDRMYAVGLAASQDAGASGFEVYRTGDGTTYERVVADGFSIGDKRNTFGLLTEFKGELYLSGTNYDPRLLLPENPSEQFPPKGFKLYKSADGKQWTQVGEDGFGVDSSYTAWMTVHGEDLYLAALDYHRGDQLWRSSDGTKWELIFQEPIPSWFGEGGGSVEFNGHVLWYDNDLKRGFEVWRTDAVVVAEATTTTVSGDTSTTTAGPGSGGGVTTDGTAGGSSGGTGSGGTGGGDSQGGAEDEAGAASGGLSGGILALIIVLAVVAVAAIGVAAYVFGTSRGRGARGAATPGAAETLSAGQAVFAGPPPVSPGFCPNCGSAFTPNSAYCAGCGNKR